MPRKQFTFYRSFYNSLLCISGNKRYKLLWALVEYALDETEPQLKDEACRSTFESIRPNLDRARRLAEGGKRGGETSRGGGRPTDEEKQAYNKPETSLNQAQNKQEKGKDKGKDKIYKGGSLFSSVFEALDGAGVQTADKAEEIEQYASRFGCERVCEAVDKAKARGINNWAYIRTILDNQATAPAPQQNSIQFQRHGDEISPLMREAARRLMEQAKAEEDTE